MSTPEPSQGAQQAPASLTERAARGEDAAEGAGTHEAEPLGILAFLHAAGFRFHWWSPVGDDLDRNLFP